MDNFYYNESTFSLIIKYLNEREKAQRRRPKLLENINTLEDAKKALEGKRIFMEKLVYSETEEPSQLPTWWIAEQNNNKTRS